MTYNVKIKRQGNLVRVVEAVADTAGEAMDWVEANLKRFIPDVRHEGAPEVRIVDGTLIVRGWHGYEFAARVAG